MYHRTREQIDQCDCLNFAGRARDRALDSPRQRSEEVAKPYDHEERLAKHVTVRTPPPSCYRVVCPGSSGPPCGGPGNAHLGVGFALRCVQRFSTSGRGYPAVAEARQLAHQRSGRSGPLVLGANSRNVPTPATDRDRTVSRRSEPSSRAALMGEQPNPWDRLQPQDATSRHRGAKPCRRCELLGKISLLSPG